MGTLVVGPASAFGDTSTRSTRRVFWDILSGTAVGQNADSGW